MNPDGLLAAAEKERRSREEIKFPDTGNVLFLFSQEFLFCLTPEI